MAATGNDAAMASGAAAAGGTVAEGGTASSFLLAALGRPKERKMIFRLEAELMRLTRNPSVTKLDMQAMTPYNASLVEGVARYFELDFSFVDADADAADEASPGVGFSSPAAAGSASANQTATRTVTLRKTELSAVPITRLEELVPGSALRPAAVSRLLSNGSSGGAVDQDAGRADSPDCLDSGKVQLMRRAKTQSQDTARERVRLSPEEVAEKLKQKEAEYETARRRIMGEAAAVATASAAAGAAACAAGIGANGAAPQQGGSPNGHDGGSGGGTGEEGTIGGATASAGGSNKSPAARVVGVGKAAGRAQDMHDPDYDRSRLVRQSRGGMGMGGGPGGGMGGGMMGGGISPAAVAAEMARLQLNAATGYLSAMPPSASASGYGMAPGATAGYLSAPPSTCASGYGMAPGAASGYLSAVPPSASASLYGAAAGYLSAMPLSAGASGYGIAPGAAAGYLSPVPPSTCAPGFAMAAGAPSGYLSAVPQTAGASGYGVAPGGGYNAPCGLGGSAGCASAYPAAPPRGYAGFGAPHAQQQQQQSTSPPPQQLQQARMPGFNCGMARVGSAVSWPAGYPANAPQHAGAPAAVQQMPGFLGAVPGGHFAPVPGSGLQSAMRPQPGVQLGGYAPIGSHNNFLGAGILPGAMLAGYAEPVPKPHAPAPASVGEWKPVPMPPAPAPPATWQPPLPNGPPPPPRR